MGLVNKFRQLLNSNKLTEQQIMELEKNQQAAARARGQDIIAILAQASYAESKLPEEVMEQEQYRDIAQALVVSLYDAPVMRLNVEKIDEYLKHIAECFLAAIENGDEKTAKLGISALTKGITEIRQDVALSDENVREGIEASKLQVMERMNAMIDYSKERFEIQKKISRVQADLNNKTQEIADLENEINEINGEHPEYLLEIQRFTTGTISEGAARVKVLIEKIKYLDEDRKKIYSDGLKLREMEATRDNDIEQIRTQLAFTELIIDPNEAEELEKLAKEYVDNYCRIMEHEKELNKVIADNWARIMSAVERYSAPEDVIAAGNFWKERAMKKLAEEQARLEALKAMKQGDDIGGEILKCQQEINKLENEIKNKNRQLLTN